MPKKQPAVVLPAPLARWAEAPWLVAGPADRAWVQLGRKRTPITLVAAPHWLEAAPAGKGLRLYVLRGSSPAQREALERDGASYVDAGGYLHVVAPSILVHVEKRRVRPAAVPDAPLRLGPASFRVAIASLLSPKELSIAGLSRRAAASLAQTHQTLRKLEDLGLVRRTGRGPQTSRSLDNRSGLADLLRQAVLNQRRPASTSAFVYARKPEELWARISRALGDKGVLSGAAAAAVHSSGAIGATSVPRTMVRVSPSLPIAQAMEKLEASAADSGANVTLVPDKIRWSEVQPQDVGQFRVANAVSTWLDCLREPRGEDVAQQFRESTLGF